jgi:hypothetical protein
MLKSYITYLCMYVCTLYIHTHTHVATPVVLVYVCI